jgi:Flp pilus assembly protein TadD
MTVAMHRRYGGAVLIVGLLILGLACVGCKRDKPASINTGNNEDELTAFDRARDIQPTAKTVYATAQILAGQGRDAECRQALMGVLEIDPKYLPAYNALGELYMRQGDTKDAINTFVAGLEVAPNDPVLLNNLGICWLVRRKYEEAFDKFSKAAGVAPENARYRANMAVALAFMGRDDEALSLFRQILPEDEAKHNVLTISKARESAGNG